MISNPCFCLHNSDHEISQLNRLDGQVPIIEFWNTICIEGGYLIPMTCLAVAFVMWSAMIVTGFATAKTGDFRSMSVFRDFPFTARSVKIIAGSVTLWPSLVPEKKTWA